MLGQALTESYVVGMLDGRGDVVRISRAVGDTDTADAALARQAGNVVVSKTSLAMIANLAKIEGDNWITRIESRVKEVLVNALSLRAQSKVAADSDRLAMELGSAMRGLTSVAERGATAFASGARPMKIRDQARYEEWQRTRSPLTRQSKEDLLQQINSPRYQAFLARIEERAERDRRNREDREWKRWIEGAREKPPRTLKDGEQNVRLRTERLRAYNQGVWREAMLDPNVIMLQFTTKRDGRVCDICAEYDLWTVRKDSPELASAAPPLHWYCRCYLMVVTIAASKAYDIGATPRRDWPEALPADGFGGWITEIKPAEAAKTA